MAWIWGGRVGPDQVTIFTKRAGSDPARCRPCRNFLTHARAYCDANFLVQAECLIRLRLCTENLASLSQPFHSIFGGKLILNSSFNLLQLNEV